MCQTEIVSAARWLVCLLIIPSCLLAEEHPRSSDLETALRQHIVKLSSPRFVEREAASTALVAAGIDAIDALREAEQSPDWEVRKRARQAIREIMLKDRPRLLAMLKEGALLDAIELDSLPGWQTLSEWVDDHQAAQVLLAEALETNWDFLEAAHADNAMIDSLLSERCVQLLRTRSQTQRMATRGDITAVMLSGLLDTNSLGDQTLNNVFTVVNHARPSISGDRMAIQNIAFRQLACELIRRSSQSTAAFQGLNLALTLDLQEGLTAATEVLQRRDSRAHVKVFALLTVMRFGAPEDLSQVEPFLEDDQVYHSAPHRNRAQTDESAANSYSVEVRDVALACRLHLEGAALRDAGFTRAQKHPNYVFNPATLGFDSVEARKTAFDTRAR